MHRIHKTISEFLSHGTLPSVGLDDFVSDAVKIMQEQGSDCALVIDPSTKELAGIFTERDFLNRVAAEQRTPTQTAMRDVMTANPQTLRPHDNISYAINRMVVRGFRNIPIVDDKGHPIDVLDVRHVMDHVNEVFAEITDGKAGKELDEWVDIGGG